MKGRLNWLRLSALAAVALLVACDDDPTEPGAVPLAGDFSVVPDTIGVQEPIKVVFNRAIDPATALDPANFVVTDLCDTLRVSGSLRLSGDTLVFSPSEALPFLTLLSIRVQNILDEAGNALPQPITFQRITSAPAVSDVSWEFLNSPTSDLVTGISFADRDTGYLVTNAGSVYRTVNGGLVFGARFKDPDITQTFNIETFGGDTVMFLGATLAGASTAWAVFQSTDSAITFTPSNTANRQLFRSQMRSVGGTIVGVVGGQGSTPGLYRYHAIGNTLTPASGAPSSSSVLITDVALSPDTIAALATFYNTSTNEGLAYVSTNGGASYTPLVLPANTRRLRGTGFIDDGTGIIVGDSSTAFLVDVGTGQLTQLGAAQGIPQTEIVGTATTVFSFTRARFAPGSSVGWIVGSVTRRQPGSADVVQGVILQSRDGGLTWSRQAISSAPENGLGFSVVVSLQALAPDFAAVGGLDGLVAARTDDSQPSAAACSFSQ